MSRTDRGEQVRPEELRVGPPARHLATRHSVFTAAKVIDYDEDVSPLVWAKSRPRIR
jgi:hypothetical protein